MKRNPELLISAHAKSCTTVNRLFSVCRVLAFVSLICFGWGAASNLFQAVATDPQLGPFMQPRVTPGWYALYAFLCAVLGVASCVGLLGFAELLHLFISLEAASRPRRGRSPPDGEDAADV